MPAGSGIQRYIAAFGASTTNPASRSAATAASRRRWSSARIGATSASAWSSAAAPAFCTARNGPVSVYDFTWVSAEISSGRPTAKPIRQPVIEKLLESEKNSRATSRAPAISKMLGARYPSKVRSQYALS